MIRQGIIGILENKSELKERHIMKEGIVRNQMHSNAY
jgi:hypothetical protein